MQFRISFLSFSLWLVLFATRPTHEAYTMNYRLSDTSDSRARNARMPLERMLDQAIQYKLPAQLQLGSTAKGRKIEAWYFPGTSDKRALIIGGVHGSELSAIEVARALVDSLLKAEQPYYSVIIIPALFPDNAAAAIDQPEQMGSVLNIGRYSAPNAVDPNRQMPSPGTAFNGTMPLDHVGRLIEKENQLLLQLIQYFRPSRIANLHAIRNTGYGGIYADPRTDENSLALGYDSDSSLAVEMARQVEARDGNVNGNRLSTRTNALYYKDPQPVKAGQWQKRNMTGSFVSANRGSGVSMGTWGTTAIRTEVDSSRNRDAMRVLTLEFPGARRALDHKSMKLQQQTEIQVAAFVSSIQKVFLGKYYPEDPA